MIVPIDVITNNVSRELVRIASQNNIATSDLCIRLHSTSTFVKDADSEFVEISHDDFDQYTDEESMRNPEIEYEQKYDITIEPKPKKFSLVDFMAEIEFQENATFAYLVIKKGSKLTYSDTLYDALINHIVELQLRSNIMINLLMSLTKQALKIL